MWVGGIRFSEYQIKVHPSQINQRVEVHDKICSHIKKKRKENDKFKLAKGKLWVYKGKSKIIIFKRGLNATNNPSVGQQQEQQHASLKKQTKSNSHCDHAESLTNNQERVGGDRFPLPWGPLY